MTVAVADSPPELAVMVAVPCPTAVTLPALSTVATAWFEDVHVAELVTSVLVPATVTAEAVMFVVSALERRIPVVESVIRSTEFSETKKSPHAVNSRLRTISDSMGRVLRIGTTL